MTWGEALRLTTILAADPGSQVATALHDWAHPFPRESVILADLYDAHEAGRVGRRAKPYPRPWEKQRHTFGSGTRLSKAQLRAVLDAHRKG